MTPGENTGRRGPKLHETQNSVHAIFIYEGQYGFSSLKPWGDQKYMKCRILSIQHTYMKAHMDWSNGVQDKGGQTCGNIIPRHINGGVQKGCLKHTKQQSLSPIF